MRFTAKLRQRFILLGMAGDNEALEVTGYPYDSSSISIDTVSWNRQEATIRVTLSSPTINTIKLPVEPHGIWTRLISWLEACPLRRQPDTTAYPAI